VKVTLLVARSAPKLLLSERVSSSAVMVSQVLALCDL
jgi:hypothetical protein